MQTGRQFEIIYLLMGRSPLTTAELAKELEVSRRTIRRDIDALSAAGIPVYMTRGKGGGVHLLENYVLDSSLLSDDEQREILSGLTALQATGGLTDAATATRLGRIFQREPTNWLDIDFSFWGAPPEYRHAFALIKEAIFSQRRLRLRYYDAKDNATERVIEPARLLFKESCWYLRAFCLVRNDWRTFKLFRIDWESMELLPDRFDPKTPPDDLGEEYGQATGQTRVTLRFTARMKERVREEFAPDMIEFLDDGATLVTLDCMLDDRTRHHFLSYGVDVEVLEPESLRMWIAGIANDLTHLYR